LYDFFVDYFKSLNDVEDGFFELCESISRYVIDNMTVYIVIQNFGRFVDDYGFGKCDISVDDIFV
jgi:hypothetical protein